MKLTGLSRAQVEESRRKNGSNTLTHINDASFWLFKGYFDLSVKDTLKTWGLLELCNSIVGLGAVLLIATVV